MAGMSRGFNSNFLLFINLMHFAKMHGLVTFKYNNNEGRFEDSKWSYIYCLAFLVLLFFFLPRAAFLYVSDHEFFEQALAVLPYGSHSLLCVVTISGIWFQIRHRKKFVIYLNEILEITSELAGSTFNSKDNMFVFIVILQFVANMMQFIAGMYFMIINKNHGVSDFVWVQLYLYKYFTKFTLATTAALFVPYILIIKKFLKSVNCELRGLGKELPEVEDVTNLCANLGKLKQLCSKIYELAINVNRIFQAQILGFLLHSFFHGCNQTYYMYHYIRSETFDEDYVQNFIPFVAFITLDFLHLFLIIFVCSSLRDEVNSIRFRLAKLLLIQNLHCDILKLIDEFSNLIIVEELKITACGLFTYSKNFALSVAVSTVINFFIMVQFEKNLK